MLCSSCYKKIPEGEEVTKSGRNYFRASWHSGYGTEIYCKKFIVKSVLKRKIGLTESA